MARFSLWRGSGILRHGVPIDGKPQSRRLFGEAWRGLEAILIARGQFDT